MASKQSDKGIYSGASHRRLIYLITEMLDKQSKFSKSRKIRRDPHPEGPRQRHQRTDPRRFEAQLR